VYWLLHILGLDSGSGPAYLWWSGAGSDLAYLGIFWALVRKHNCHQPRCWRIGHLPVPGTAWQVCRRHHPAPPQRGSIREHYHLYLGDKPGRG